MEYRDFFRHAATNKRVAASYRIGNLGMIIIVSAILILGLSATNVIKLPIGSVSPGNSGGGTCLNNYQIALPSYMCGASLSMTFSLVDPIAGGIITTGSPTVKVYNGNVQIDSASIGSGGTGATGQSTYNTGQTWTCYITATNYISEYVPCQVPPIPTSQSPASTVTVPLYDFKSGAWSMSCTGTGGTTFSTGQSYIWASSGLSSITLSCTLTESNNNQGWKSTYDPINQLMDDQVMQVDDGGGASTNSQYLTITGEQYTVKIGTTNYFLEVLPDGVGTQIACSAGSASCNTNAFPTDQLGRYSYNAGTTNVAPTTTTGTLASLTGSSTQQLVGTTPYGGSVTWTWNVAQANLAVGNTITLTYKLRQNYDPTVFVKTGLGNPSSGNPVSVNIGTGSTFTIKFTG